ncbi:MAG: hypothetical protein LAO21_03425 [Acidobacteriia bacterium]|nr:hypothetical protein [Terriglobia bacterium]
MHPVRLKARQMMAATLANVPERYENYYYTLESPGSNGGVHEYLHSVVREHVKANFTKHRSKLREYYRAGKAGPMSKSYQQDAGFTEECLVRALDKRIEIFLGGALAKQKAQENLLKEWRGKGCHSP